MPVNDKRDSWEKHFLYTKAEFSEFLVRLGRFVVCSSPIHCAARFSGETCMVGLPCFEVKDFSSDHWNYLDSLLTPEEREL